MYKYCEAHGRRANSEKFCARCGKPTGLLERYCPSCGHTSDYISDDFCDQCGTKMDTRRVEDDSTERS